MDTHFTPQELMNEISKIPRMLRGKLCVIRQGPNGPYYNCQCWQNGKNVAHYVPKESLDDYQEPIDGYKRFQTLTEQYAEQMISQTRDELAKGLKKKMRSPKSSSPKKRRSKN